MTERDKRYGVISMAMKAGGVASGADTALTAIRKGRAYEAVIDCYASDKTRKRFRNSCEYYGVWYTIFGEKETLGRCIGKEERSVLVLTNESLAGAFIEQTGRNDVDGENKDF